jgi:hypothetical protein
MLISMKLEELELVTFALDKHLSDRSNGLLPTTDAMELLKKLAQQAKSERRMRQPVTVMLRLPRDAEYFAMLNPETDEVEVRFQGVPVMSGEWRKPWFREGIDDEPEHESIQRRDEYDGMIQPTDAVLEVLSVAMRHALVYR